MLLWSASIVLAAVLLIICSKLLKGVLATVEFLGPHAVMMVTAVFIGLVTIAYLIHGMLLVP